MAIPSRTKVLILLGGLLVVLAVTGVFNSRSDVNIEADEAIEIARPMIDFEPTIEEARLIRQGFSRRPVWGVVFAIPEPDGGRDDFEKRTTVKIDAGSGEIIEVVVDSGN
jgi:hypothetical protein